MATSNGEVTGVVETTVQVTGDVNPARGTISTGDMLKEVYDTNDDGIVNAADEAATLTDLTATVEELNYSSGLTGNIQDQLDGKADDDDIPTDLADLQDDATHRLVTDVEKTEWSGKSDFSGSYNDLTDKPVIPDAQIQSDWNQSDNTKVDFIKNKPTIPTEQVNSDWNASSGKAEILNKPTIPTALSDLSDDSSHRTVTDTEKTAWNSGEANVQSNWNETDTSSDAYIQNKPTIPSVTANPGSTTATLSSIGIDGTNYAISGGGGGGAVDSVNGKTGVVILDATDVGALPDDTPLFSGDYEDLTNKPTIPDDLADLNDDSTHRLVTDTEKTTWNGKSDFSGSYNDLSNKPTLGSASALDVASSGDASTTQVVKGDDSRLSDARTPVSHTHTTSDITDFPTMSDYIQKSNTSGLVKNDGTIDTNSYATTSQIPDITGKADKVTSAVDGNFAGLDSNGNLTDSGHKHSDYLTSHQDISGKADKVSGATNGNLASLNGEGNLTDSEWNGAKGTTSINGNPISISGLKSNQLAKDPIITFEPIQAGSGTPSPSNVRAISGYDKVEVESCGKNLVNCLVANSTPSDTTGDAAAKRIFTADTWVIGLSYNNYYSPSAVSNISKSEGAISGTSNNIYGIGYVKKLIKGVTYTLSLSTGSGTSVYIMKYGKDGTYLGADLAGTFIVENDTEYVVILIAGTNSNFSATSIQLELGNEATSYAPYHKTTDLSESIGQTVYGGTLDLRSGKFTVDRAIVDLANLTWYFYESNCYVSYNLNDIVSPAIYPKVLPPASNNDDFNAVCEKYQTDDLVTILANKTTTIGIGSNVEGTLFFVMGTGSETTPTGKMVYPLLTPFTIQLTPHEISLLKDYAYVSTNGTNIVFDYHNGELASLSDVAQLAETYNRFADYIKALINS